MLLTVVTDLFCQTCHCFDVIEACFGLQSAGNGRKLSFVRRRRMTLTAHHFLLTD